MGLTRSSGPKRKPVGGARMMKRGNRARRARALKVKGSDMIDYLKAWVALKTDNRGVTAMEYALIGSLIAVVIIVALSAVGTKVASTFNTISSSL